MKAYEGLLCVFFITYTYRHDGIDRLLSLDGMLYPARWYLVFRSFWDNIPSAILSCLRYMPNRESRRFRVYLDYIRKFGRELVAKTQVDNEAAGKDVMSVLLRANATEGAGLKISDIELIDQIS